MKRYIKASTENKDIVITYRNKIIYDGPISAEPTEIFKNIKNFNPESNLADKHLVQYFERTKDTLSDYAYAQSSYRNGLVKLYAKENFNPNSIVPKQGPDPNTAVIDGERRTAEEIADDAMLEADNDEYVYNRYQELLSDYAKKVVENGWENTSRDRVPHSATECVIDIYNDNHSTRRKNLKSFCRKFLVEHMQQDYDRYKAEYRR